MAASLALKRPSEVSELEEGSRKASATDRNALLLVGCYTKDHEPLAYYTNKAEEGVYVVELNTTDGELTLLHGPFAAGTNPTYATFDPLRAIAYFTNENLDKGCVKAFRLEQDKKLTPLNSLPVDGVHPCFLGMTSDYRSVLCANYVSGDVTVFPTAEDGSLLVGTKIALPSDGPYPGKVEVRQDKTHAHCFCALGTSGFGLCCDLGSDQLLSLSINDGTVVDKVKFPPGSGPRHLAVSPDTAWIYVSSELGNTISAIPVNVTTGKLGPIAASASLLPSGYEGPATTAAHIELSIDGRFAYVGNRVGVPLDGACKDAAEGSISVIEIEAQSPDKHLTFVECFPIGGKVPRSHCVVDDWLVVAAQESSQVRSFSIGPDGKLSFAHDLAIPSPGVITMAKPKPISSME